MYLVCRLLLPQCYLPSFPTRRSSDLQRALDPGTSECTLAVGDLIVIRGESTSNIQVPPTSYSASDCPGISLNPQGTIIVFHRPGDQPGDRKSTRLNSSHRCISYAVFCSLSATSPLSLHDALPIFSGHSTRAQASALLLSAT